MAPGWHWTYFLDTTRSSELGPDGHPRRGEFMPPVELPREEFVVANTSDLKAYAEAGSAARRFSTETEAHQYRQSLIRTDSTLAEQVQVVAKYELAG